MSVTTGWAPLEMPTLVGLRLFACPWLTKSILAPSRPRTKKTNKRQTRRYWKKQPKFVQVRDDKVVRVGDYVYAHPKVIERLQTKIAAEEYPSRPRPVSAVSATASALGILRTAGPEAFFKAMLATP